MSHVPVGQHSGWKVHVTPGVEPSRSMSKGEKQGWEPVRLGGGEREADTMVDGLRLGGVGSNGSSQCHCGCRIPKITVDEGRNAPAPLVEKKTIDGNAGKSMHGMVERNECTTKEMDGCIRRNVTVRQCANQTMGPWFIPSIKWKKGEKLEPMPMTMDATKTNHHTSLYPRPCTRRTNRSQPSHLSSTSCNKTYVNTTCKLCHGCPHQTDSSIEASNKTARNPKGQMQRTRHVPLLITGRTTRPTRHKHRTQTTMAQSWTRRWTKDIGKHLHKHGTATNWRALPFIPPQFAGMQE